MISDCRPRHRAELLKRRQHIIFIRRQFLLTTAGTGIGFILPSFYDKALSYWENHEEALIVPTKDTDTVLYARQERELELYLGSDIDEYRSRLYDEDEAIDLYAEENPEKTLDSWGR